MADEPRNDEELEKPQRTPHVPDPTAMSGTLDTSGTAGSGGHTDLRNLAPIFDVAEARDLGYARRALDPEDRAVPADHVQTSQGITVVQGDPEGERGRVLQRADAAEQRLRDLSLERHLQSDRGPLSDARREEDERAWASAVSSLGPATVIGDTELGAIPAAPASVIDNRPEEERAPEGVPSVEGAREETEELALAPETQTVGSEDARTINAPDSGTQTVNPATHDGAQEGAEATQESDRDPAEEESPEPSSGQSEAVSDDSGYRTPDSGVAAPNKASSKQEWVDWAVACGADPDYANEQSRLKLISEFAKYRPNER
jgi:hypothetical protein